MLESEQKIKSFGDIKGYNDFFRFFDSRFELISEEQDNFQITKIYRVSKDEKLGVQAAYHSEPSFIDDCNYSIILYSKKEGSEFDQIRIFGSMMKKNSSIVLAKDEFLDKSITNKSIIKLMNKFNYADQSVNPHLLLIGLDNKHRYIYGSLKKWKREEDGKLILSGSLTKKVQRRRIWERKHPSRKLKNYTLNECKKAHCIHFKNDKCEFLMLPNNDSKLSYKLNNAKGYCTDYSPKSLSSYMAKLKSIFDKERETYEQKYRDTIKELENTQEFRFDHNIMSQDFDRKKFSALISLLNNVKEDDKKKHLEKAKLELEELKYKFDNIISLGENLFIRIITKKGYKLAKSDFENTRDSIRSDLVYTLEEIIDLKKDIELKNKLIKELFIGREEVLRVKYEDLREGYIVYFRDSSKSDSYGWRTKTKTYEYKNIGRIIGENDKWQDEYLALNYHYTPRYNKISELEKYPIYTVISVRKAYIELKEFELDKIIRLIRKREYHPYILFKSNQYIPQIRKYSQSDMSSFI